MALRRLIALTAIYFLIGRASLLVAFVHGTVSPVWPPTGLAIAALTIWGPRLWPAVALGAFAANALIGDPIAVAAGIAVGNTLEAVLGALALRRLGVRGEVARLRDAVAILVVAVLAPLPSATGGVLSVTLAGYAPWARYPWVWLVWWVGDFMGALLVLPLMLAWLGQRAPYAAPSRPAEFIGALVLSAAAVAVVYLHGDVLAMLGVERLPLSALLFPSMVWAVLRLPPRQAITVVAVAAVLAVGFAVDLSHDDTLGPLLWLQMLLLSVGGGSLLLIGVLAERAQAARAQQIAMAQVEAAKARLEFALESAHASLWDWDVPTNRVRWSDEYSRATGVDCATRPDFDAWVSTVLPEDREHARQVAHETLERKEKSFRTEFRVRDTERGIRWLMGIGQVTYGEGGAPLRVVGLNIDISDLKRAEEEARSARQEAEQANRAKSRFLATASHDLRQPVQALVLLNSALADRMAGREDADIVAKMGEALDSLQRLVNALLDVTRLDAGTVVPSIETVPLGSVIARMADEYSVRAAGQGLAFRAIGSSAWVRTDLTLLERVVRNLIENALHYTERGKVLIGCRRRGGSVRLCVADTGVGIPPEHQQAIFQEFYRIGRLEKDGDKGLGLGLSIVSRLCALLGHPVSLASKPGRGSCFMVELPLVPPGE